MELIDLIDLIVTKLVWIAYPPVMLTWLALDAWWNAKETK